MLRRKHDIPSELSSLKLGGVYILHMPGELFVEYQLAAQQMRPIDTVCMAAYGDTGTGYIDTEIAYSQGGYETQTSSTNTAPLSVSTGLSHLGIASIPFEVFAEIGLEIKARNPFKDTFTIELANGSNGYLPTPRHQDLGGYETWLGANRVEREASDKIAARALEMLQQVRTSP